MFVSAVYSLTFATYPPSDTTRHGPVPQPGDSENGILPLPSVRDIIPPRASSDGLPDVSLGPSLTTLTAVDDASMPIVRHYPRAFDSPSYHVPSFSSIPQVGISTHSAPSPWYPAPIPLGPEYPNTFYETQAMPQLEGYSRFSLSPRVRTMGTIAEDMYCGLPSQSQSNATLALGRPTFGCDHSPLLFGDQSQHVFDQAVIHGNGADNSEIFVPYYPNSSIPPAQAYETLQAASPRGTIISDPKDPWATLRHPGHGSL